MRKLIALLKYLDRSKINAESVKELAAMCGRKPTDEQAAEVAKVFSTRGESGLLSLVPDILSWSRVEDGESDPALLVCPKCGAFISSPEG